MKRLVLAATLVFCLMAGHSPSFAQNRPNTRNPFAPLDKKAAPTSAKISRPANKPLPQDPESLQLQAILWNSSNPVAIIDYTVVRVGGEIMGRKVVAITVDHVEVEYFNKKETLTMTPKMLFSVTGKKSASESHAEREQTD